MEIIIIVICLILCAFFSGMEIAFVSSNKIYLEIEKKQDSFISKILTKLTEKPSQFITTMLVGNNIALVIYGFYMGDLLMTYILSWGYHFTNFTNLLIQTILSTLLVLVTSEFLPKVFFQIYANNLIKFFAVPAYVFYTLFYYISVFTIWISDIVLKKFFKTEGDQVQLHFSKTELGDYISQQMDAIDNQEELDSEIQIFQNALEFSGVKAREIMTPRTEIQAIEMGDSIIHLRQMFIETGYSKILVYQNSLDDIVGYIHSFELFKKPKHIKDITIPIEFVPETIFIKDVMDLLTKKRKSVAIVLDEYGGTSGIITMEDIVEELFGDIQDEHDLDEELLEQAMDNGSYLFSARLDVQYINETYKLNIPEGDSYETLGGYIVNYTNEIPQTNDEIYIENFKFDIEEASNNKILTVKLTKIK